MNIGTAKPNRKQIERIEHCLVDIREPNEPINLREFKKVADLLIEKTIKTDQMALLVGGSGLYLQALTHGLIPPPVPPNQCLRKQLKEIGQKSCYQILESCDPLASKRIAAADAVRTQRALEVFYATGKSITSLEKSNRPSWKIIEIGLDPGDLNERIIERTNWMYQNGLLKETQQLIDDFGKDLPLLQTIGYKEALDVLLRNLDLEEAMQKTITRTKQLAKKQRTWFRKKHNAVWLKDEEPAKEALSLIQRGLG